MKDKPCIFLGMPFYHGSVEMEAVIAALTPSSGDFRVMFAPLGGSNIAKAFNTLWANALNRFESGECEFFGLLHADCVPRGDFLHIQYHELLDRKLDLISVVSPIKSPQGLTSTGCDIAGNDPWRVRRFTMTEVMTMPDTFDQADTIAAGLNTEATPLLVNTGCMMIDMRNPKWLETDEQGNLLFCFTFYDRIRRDEDNDLMAHSISEDWDWSRMMARRGMRYAATRKVHLIHQGRKGYSNATAWGAWKYDRAHPELANCAYSEDGTPLAAFSEVDLEAVG